MTLWQPKYLPSGEVLLSSDFESPAEGGLFPWRISGEVLREAGGGYRGSAGVKLTGGGVQRSVLEWTLTGPKRFAFLGLRGRMRTEGVEAGDKGWEEARLLLYFRDGAGNARWDREYAAASLTGSSDWRQHSRVFPVPEFAATAHVRVENGGLSGSLWCDDVSLRAMTANPVYVRLRRLLFGLIALVLTAYAAVSGARRGEGMVPAFVAAAILLGVLVSAQWLGAAASALGVPVAMLKKTGHFLLFLGFSYALLRRQGGRAAGPPGLRSAALLLAALMGFAAATELLQLTTVDRSPSVADWLIDAAGVLLGSALAFVQLRERSRNSDN